MAEPPGASNGRERTVLEELPALTLQPDARAPSAARRFVRQALADLDLEPLQDVVALAVSELVTNALLHVGAGPELTVRVVPLPPAGVRIEVADASTALPRSRHYASTAAVGRGLGLLSALGEWGVHLRPGAGKVVWFEATVEEPDDVRAGSPDDAARSGPPDDESPAAVTDAGAVLGRYDTSRDEPLVPVQLLRFPLQVFVSARVHHDELIREFSLLAIAADTPGPDRHLPRRLVALIEALGHRYRRTAERTDQVRDSAAERGELTADLTYHVPPSAQEALIRLDGLMEEADRFCRTEHLLTLAADPVERRFRRWFTDQFIRQLAGEPPTPWTGPLEVPDLIRRRAQG